MLLERAETLCCKTMLPLMSSNTNCSSPFFSLSIKTLPEDGLGKTLMVPKLGAKSSTEVALASGCENLE